MEFDEVLRSTAAVRDFTDEAVSDEDLYAILDVARFSPSGGNRQGWRVVVVKDAKLRAALGELYLPTWYAYLSQRAAGLVGWSPLADRAKEAEALGGAESIAAQAAAGPGGFAEHFASVPALLAVFVDLRAVSAMDRDLERYQLVGGASVYPFVWSILLAARNAGLGGVLTTVLVRSENAVRTLLGVPEHYTLAAVVALGHPQHRVTRLRRAAVEDFATTDRFDGAPLTPTS